MGGYANFPVDDMAEAAKVLQQHVKDYKIDVQAQLDKETGLLVNFIQDLEGKFAAQVAALSLGAFVERLKAANEAVRELTGQRTDERSAKTAGALMAAAFSYSSFSEDTPRDIDYKDVAELLIKSGADNGTALIWAIKESRSDAVELLIKAGADVNATDSEGISVLTHAIPYGQNDIADLLRAAGAKE